MAIKKKKKPVNKIAELTKKNKDLENQLLAANNLIDYNLSLIKKIKVSLNLYEHDEDTEIFEIIGELKTKHGAAVAALKDTEGRRDRLVSDTQVENNRLWYLVRVAMKDPTIEQDSVKPGDEIIADGVGRRHPFNGNYLN